MPDRFFGNRRARIRPRGFVPAGVGRTVHADVNWGILVATIGLVAATCALGYFTLGLVQEAKASRLEAALPRLTFDVNPLDGSVGVLLIRNVGRGAALAVELTVTYEGPDDVVRWREPSVVPGESHELNLPAPYLQDLSVALEHPLAIRVAGTMRDVGGRRHDVSERLDVTEWWRTNVEARERVAGRRKLPGSSPP